MSLIDTIRAAREEAQQNMAGLNGEARTEQEKTAPASEGAGGFSRRSAARAKPRRERAGSVSVASSSAKTAEKDMTKEERKARRAEQRRREDLAYDASQTVLKQQPGYERGRRIWWATMGGGLGCTFLSWGIMHYVQESGVQSEVLTSLSVVLMVVAYALIIGGFIYDFRKVRPMRQRADELVSGMTQKKMRKLVDEEAAKKDKA